MHDKKRLNDMARRLAVIVAADVVDYTAMMEEDEDAAIALIRELREMSLEPVVTAHGGEVLKRMGDGWIIAFGSAAAALDCAIEVQTGLADHPKLRLRMGVHMGDIVEDEQDFYGAGVNLAARLQTEAPPGGVMISADLHRQLGAKQAAAFTDAGTFKLKNIAQPVSGFQWRPAGVAGARADEVPVISVEPFAAAPDDGETRSAAADLREQIVLGLSRRTGLRVRDAAIGQGGKATYALRGRLRNSGGRGRLNLSLVLCEDGSNVWSDAFDSDGGDLFDFSDAAAAWADTQLRLQINKLDGDRIARLPDDALSGSELRSRAASEFYRGTIQSFEHSLALLDRALRLNPEDAMATGMRSEAIVYMALVRHETPAPEVVARLVSDLDRALESMPRSDFMLYARAGLRTYFLADYEAALQDVRRCLRLNPGYLMIREIEGAALLGAGRFAAAAEAFKAVVEGLSSDPLTPFRSYLMAIARFCAGDAAGAVVALNDLIDIRPNLRAYRKLRAIALRELGDAKGAAADGEAAARLPDEYNFHAPRPSLPETHRWLADALAPGAP